MNSGLYLHLRIKGGDKKLYIFAASPPLSLIWWREGESINATSILSAPGLKDRYLIPFSVNKIRHSDKTPSPELFLQHYVIGLPGQEYFLNKAFSNTFVWAWPVLTSHTHWLQPQSTQLNARKRHQTPSLTCPLHPLAGEHPKEHFRAWWHMQRPESVEAKCQYRRSKHISSEGSAGVLPHIPFPAPTTRRPQILPFGCCCPLPSFLDFLIFVHE